MIISLFLGLIIGAAAVVFALQNIFPVTVSFLGWELTASLATIIILSMVVGILTSILIAIPGSIRNALTISRLKKENKKLFEKVGPVVQTEKETVVTRVETPTDPTI